MKDDLKIPDARDLPPGRRHERREQLVAVLSRMGVERRRRPSLLLAVTAAVVLLVATVGMYAAWSRQQPSPPQTFNEADYRWNFHNVREMVATSDLVILGTVTAAERADVSNQGDVIYTTRLLHLGVDERLFGTVDRRVIVEDLGWESADGREIPWRVEGLIRLEVGDRAILFLHLNRTTGRFGMLNDQAGYRVQGSDIADTDRTNPLVRRIEGMNVSELEQLIDEAAAAVRRGELKPVPEGGRPRSPTP